MATDATMVRELLSEARWLPWSEQYTAIGNPTLRAAMDRWQAHYDGTTDATDIPYIVTLDRLGLIDDDDEENCIVCLNGPLGRDELPSSMCRACASLEPCVECRLSNGRHMSGCAYRQRCVTCDRSVRVYQTDTVYETGECAACFHGRMDAAHVPLSDREHHQSAYGGIALTADYMWCGFCGAALASREDRANRLCPECAQEQDESA